MSVEDALVHLQRAEEGMASFDDVEYFTAVSHVVLHIGLARRELEESEDQKDERIANLEQALAVEAERSARALMELERLRAAHDPDRRFPVT